MKTDEAGNDWWIKCIGHNSFLVAVALKKLKLQIFGLVKFTWSCSVWLLLLLHYSYIVFSGLVFQEEIYNYELKNSLLTAEMAGCRDTLCKFRVKSERNLY